MTGNQSELEADGTTAFDVPKALTELRDELFRRALLLSQDRQRADDLVQATIERALSTPQSFPCLAKLKAWLKVVMRNLFIDECRLGARDRRLVNESPPPQDDECPGPVDLLCGNDIARAIGALRASDAEIVGLAYLDCRSYTEISSRLGIRATTLGTRLHRAKSRLRALLLVDYAQRLAELCGGSSRPPREEEMQPIRL